MERLIVVSRRTTLAAALGIVAFPLAALAQGPPPSAGPPQEARSVTITEIEALRFGTLIQSAGGGSVTVSPDGSRTEQGVFTTRDPAGAARFEVRVEGGTRFTILLPASATLVNARGDSMVADTFTSAPAGAGSVQPPSRVTDLLVGATLQVGAQQPAGTYFGNYLVTVTFFD